MPRIIGLGLLPLVAAFGCVIGKYPRPEPSPQEKLAHAYRGRFSLVGEDRRGTFRFVPDGEELAFSIWPEGGTATPGEEVRPIRISVSVAPRTGIGRISVAEALSFLTRLRLQVSDSLRHEYSLVPGRGERLYSCRAYDIQGWENVRFNEPGYFLVLNVGFEHGDGSFSSSTGRYFCNRGPIGRPPTKAGTPTPSSMEVDIFQPTHGALISLWGRFTARGPVKPPVRIAVGLTGGLAAPGQPVRPVSLIAKMGDLMPEQVHLIPLLKDGLTFRLSDSRGKEYHVTSPRIVGASILYEVEGWEDILCNDPRYVLTLEAALEYGDERDTAVITGYCMRGPRFGAVVRMGTATPMSSEQ